MKESFTLLRESINKNGDSQDKTPQQNRTRRRKPEVVLREEQIKALRKKKLSRRAITQNLNLSRATLQNSLQDITDRDHNRITQLTQEEAKAIRKKIRRLARQGYTAREIRESLNLETSLFSYHKGKLLQEDRSFTIIFAREKLASERGRRRSELTEIIQQTLEQREIRRSDLIYLRRGEKEQLPEKQIVYLQKGDPQQDTDEKVQTLQKEKEQRRVIEMLTSQKKISWKKLTEEELKIVLELAAEEKGIPISFIGKKDTDKKFSFLQEKTLSGLYAYIEKHFPRPTNSPKEKMTLFLEKHGFTKSDEDIIAAMKIKRSISWKEIPDAVIKKFIERIAYEELHLHPALLRKSDFEEKLKLLNGSTLKVSLSISSNKRY